jgi:transcriptional regulator with XRE-family HTH domain
MARPKRELNSNVKKEMHTIASQFKKFREANKLSQKFLAEIVVISRRTIQSIESGTIIPQSATIKAFEELRSKYSNEGRPTGQRKHKKTKEEGEF